MKYVIYEADAENLAGATETGMSSMDQWEAQPEIRLDVNGVSMRVVKVFEANSWDEAMQVYYDHYGYGKYVPVES